MINILTLLLESKRCAIRSWAEICPLTNGKDPRTTWPRASSTGD
ncbi:MAG TPA: hypothetical protein VIC54_06495 [Terriglobales bacterium]